MKTRFIRCPRCGNIVGVIHDVGVPMFCCGIPMEDMVPNTTDASEEKHKPVVHIENGVLTARIGAADHPMTEEHSIPWVYIKTNCGGHRIQLQPGQEPCVTLHLGDELPEAVYAYCNLHGLWMTEV